MNEYIQTIFQVYNSRSREGQYNVDSRGNIYYCRQGQSSLIGNLLDIDYVIIGPFENNILLQGKLAMARKLGKYLLHPEGPKLSGGNRVEP